MYKYPYKGQRPISDAKNFIKYLGTINSSVIITDLANHELTIYELSQSQNNNAFSNKYTYSVFIPGKIEKVEEKYILYVKDKKKKGIRIYETSRIIHLSLKKYHEGENLNDVLTEVLKKLDVEEDIENKTQNSISLLSKLLL
jgi:hypothetical protein